jgi:hypothetical protein
MTLTTARLLGIQRMTPPEGGTVCGNFIPGNVSPLLTKPLTIYCEMADVLSQITVNVHSLAVFLDPANFHEPTSFCPERWLPEGKAPESPFRNDKLNSVQVFNIGPRMCLGKPLALAEMRLILARLLWAFDASEADTPAGKLVWEEQRTFIVVEKKPFDIKLSLRH